MTETVLWALVPWAAVPAFLLWAVRLPRSLPGSSAGGSGGGGPVEGQGGGNPATGDPVRHEESRPPLVSIVVPARNEADNIEACLKSLVASDYPRFEILVVDDRSEDGTGALARRVATGNAQRLEVIDGAPVPEGWLGKPWACAQGAERARGDLILFTDADTVHGSGLLGRAVAGMEEDGADLLTLLGVQVMESFWERVVQPHIFFLMTLRYPSFERLARSPRWRDAIANGQFLLFRRSAYEALGGHRSVAGEVVEDQALAQRAKQAGLSISIRAAEDDLRTRMYRSLRAMVEGWTKNVVLGGRASLPPALRPLMAPSAAAAVAGLWLVPPAVFLAAWAGVGWGWLGDGPGWLAGMGGASTLRLWATSAVVLSLISWVLFLHYMRASRRYALTYPLGAAVAVYILLKAWIRGTTVVWKGRRYEVESRVEEDLPGPVMGAAAATEEDGAGTGRRDVRSVAGEDR